MLGLPSWVEEAKAACALIGVEGARGTAFLVSADRLLTCHHVVQYADGSPVTVAFSHGQYQATVELVDAENDCALLRLRSPVPGRDAQPLPLAPEGLPRGGAWEGYGFPAVTGQAGLLIAGRVQDPAGQDPALRPAVVLHSANVTAGSWLNGFSGSPVLAEGRVIGQMRTIISDPAGGAQLAIIYACPAAILADLTRRRVALGTVDARGLAGGARVFYVPPPLGPHFTGREQWLTALRQKLRTSRTVALWGLGGIGKTQTAIAFAHRQREDYGAVLWLPGDSPSGFEQGLIDLARPLAQAGRLRASLVDEQDPASLRRAVLDHLRQAEDYLLLCDNVDTPLALKPVWPRGLAGQVLLTSRSHDIRRLGAVVLEMGTLSHQESRALLMRCHPAQGDEEADALSALAAELDGLPLALAQAVAYLSRHRSRYDAYLRGYRQKKLALLEKGLPDDDYPHSVASTWALSIEQVESESRPAVDFLRLCAVLQPDAIPEELFSEPTAELGGPLREALAAQAGDAQALDELLAPLLRYALVQREPVHRTLSLHRLVQQALLHRMAPTEQARWVAAGVAQLAAVFPGNLFTNWARSRRLLPQALAVFAHMDRFAVATPAAGYLLNEVGYFLAMQAQATAGEQLVRRALALREDILGAEHPDVATSLNTLAELLYGRPPAQDDSSAAQTQYVEAELLVRRALTIREEALGAEHPAVASCLNNLAALQQRLGRAAEAELFLRRALAIAEKAFGDEHPDVARGLNNLGLFLHGRGQLAEAEQLYRRSLAISDRALDPEHPVIAYVLMNLGLLLADLDRRPEAEPLYCRALSIREKTLPDGHPLIAHTRAQLEQVRLAGPFRELTSK